MTKCEKCYHYEACLNSLSENKGLNNTEGFACEHYKDKSLIVELPCRVGDVVYVLYTCDLPHEIEQVIINRINIRKESTQIVFSNNSAITVWGNEWSDYKKYVFSSREEAERALEESEKNG